MAIKTKEQIRNDAINFIPDNVNREVSPEDVRQRIIDIADSVAFTATLPTLANVAYSGAYADLTGKPTYSVVANTGSYNDLLNKPTFAEVATTGEYTDLINRPVLATVATSGNYNDLSNKPTITVGTGLQGGGTLSGSVSVALSANAVASLAKADAALPRNGSQPMTGDLTIQRGTSGAGLLLVGDGIKQIYMSNNTYGNEALIYNNPADGKLTVRPYATDNTNYKEFEFDPVTGNFNLPNNPTGPLAAVPKQLVESYSNGYRNKITNGDFDIWQRVPAGSSSIGASVGFFGPDRWIFRGTTLTGGAISIQRNPKDPAWRGRSRINIVRTGCTAEQYIQQNIENLAQFSGKTITVGFDIFPNTAQNIYIYLQGTFGTGGSPSADVLINQVNFSVPANTLTSYRTTITVPDLSGYTYGTNGNDCLNFRIGFSGIDNTTIRLSSVFLVEGEVMNESDPFSPRHPQQELALCQRYYEVIEYDLTGVATAGSQFMSTYCSFKTEKRTSSPTLVRTGGAINTNVTFNSTQSISGKGCAPYFSSNAAGVTRATGTYAVDAEI